MMSSFVGASLPGVPPAHYTQDALLEDLSRQMAISANRRQSRGSNGAYSGNAMRVAKPSSANNSPRNNLMQHRRRTMMNDPAYIQKSQQMLEQPYLPTPGPEVYGNSYCEPVKRAPRPVSWHPSTQLPQAHPQQYQQQYCMPTQQQSQYPFPTCYDYDLYAPTQMPPTPAAYSAYSSPVSFSPLALPPLPSYTSYEVPTQQTYASPCWNLSVASSMPIAQAPTPAFTTTASYTPACVPSFAEAETAYSPVSWTNVPSTGYSQNVTAPPTPEEPTKLQQPDPIVVKHEATPYLTPDGVKVEDEDEGDILIGLGLYDPPEKLHGGLLGASFEPTGKGLKLEDAWEPPVEDEEEEDDAESEEE